MWWLVVLLIITGIYIFGLALWAKHLVNSAPKTDMHLCDKHGPIAGKYLMKIDIGGDKPMPYCPRCYEERMKEAKERV
jgi:hypothetical protein